MHYSGKYTLRREASFWTRRYVSDTRRESVIFDAQTNCVCGALGLLIVIGN